MMSAIGGRDTAPELYLRRALHAAGFRFRVQRRDLPGKPDIVLPRFKIAVFIHGCFWHGHDCGRGKRPTSNVDFWNAKLDGNIRRDALNEQKLAELGWRVVIVWTCSLASQTQNLINDLSLLRQEDALSEFTR